MDAAIAQGYDPDAEYRSMLGRIMSEDELKDAELDADDGQDSAEQQQQQAASMTPDLDVDFNEQLTEEERQQEEEVMNPVGCL